MGVTITHALYKRLKNQGFLLKDVLEEGLKSLRAWRPETVDSGFALDLLEYHTTALGTAESRSRDALVARYAHRADVLDESLRLCEQAYLLIASEPARDGAPSDASPTPVAPTHRSAATRLGHDTLAPLVRERFRASVAPAQRARRLLENRAA